MLHSQRMREIAPEIDSLRLGCGWSIEDLGKPQVLIETVGGDSHPCSVHLLHMADVVREGIIEGGGVAGRYHCTDLCDGILQGTDAMDLSLPSREVMALATEMHARGGHFDGMLLISGCDKSISGHLLAAARRGFRPFDEVIVVDDASRPALAALVRHAHWRPPAREEGASRGEQVIEIETGIERDPPPRLADTLGHAVPRPCLLVFRQREELIAVIRQSAHPEARARA